MPNHITNVLRINAYEHEGAPENLIDQMLDAIKGSHGDETGDVLALDFGSVIPMPSELNIVSGGSTDDALALLSDDKAKSMLKWPWVVAEKVKTVDQLRDLLRKRFSPVPIPGINDKHDQFATLDDLAARVSSNLAKYGTTDWYQWSVDHWGTKWNAYSVTGGKVNDREAVLTFETAWSPPLPVIDAIAAKFPKACLRLIWCDEGDDKQHRVYWEHGKREIGET